MRKRRTRLRGWHLYGEDRIYPKEQQLIDLVRDELADNRPVVIFVRQTDTKDIQPRLADLIRRHVPLANPYILKNTVAADRRERVIEQEVAKGMNVIFANPELVKTGLDLVFAPSLIFYEITFNLSTMMQAAGRSLRLNQTHSQCKTYYLYYTETMEETAVYLMSRKQRAAKLLNGDIGLTGLDALTEGEAGLEEALMAAIGKEETLINPGELFKASATQSEIDAEDAAYWNSEGVSAEPETELPLLVAAPQPLCSVTPQPETVKVVVPLLFLPATIPTRANLNASETSDEFLPVDTLKLLTAEFGETAVKSDPFALKPVPLSKAPKPPAKRRRKPRMDQAPETVPMFNPAASTPQMSPLFMTQRVEPGLQIPLF